MTEARCYDGISGDKVEKPHLVTAKNAFTVLILPVVVLNKFELSLWNQFACRLSTPK